MKKLIRRWLGLEGLTLAHRQSVINQNQNVQAMSELLVNLAIRVTQLEDQLAQAKSKNVSRGGIWMH